MQTFTICSFLSCRHKTSCPLAVAFMVSSRFGPDSVRRRHSRPSMLVALLMSRWRVWAINQISGNKQPSRQLCITQKDLVYFKLHCEKTVSTQFVKKNKGSRRAELNGEQCVRFCGGSARGQTGEAFTMWCLLATGSHGFKHTQQR